MLNSLLGVIVFVGKREAEDVAEKQQVSAKKQKQNEAALKKAVAEKIEEVKIPEKTEESGSEDGSDADDSGLEDDVCACVELNFSAFFFCYIVF